MPTTSTTLNVYAGEDSLKDYYNPDVAPPLPLVEIPASLNPYRKDGVRIYAKMMTMLPAHNVKALPALNLLSDVKADRVIEYSSGSTVISMSILSRVLHNIEDTRAYLSNKTSATKLRLMQFFGLDLTLFGGPSQPEPFDPRGGIQAARTAARKDSACVNPNQYENDLNWQAHVRWTGPQLLRQLPEINVICAGMGTSGTMTGLGTFFKEAKPSVRRLGVCTAAGDRVPGPRSYALLAPVEFPWKQAVDHVEHVGSQKSYELSMALSRSGIVCGPSSGFNLQGLYQYLEGVDLDSLRGEDGEIHCVFVCCDLPYQYIDEYFTKLSPEHFPTIHNESLTTVDTYRYDDAWELTAIVANKLLPECTVVDFRSKEDFAKQHLPGSENIPLASMSTISAFRDPQVLADQWSELNGLPATYKKSVLTICYNGDTSRVATSVFRAKGIEAWSVGGGWPSISGEASVMVRKDSAAEMSE